jgi:L-lactate utilization protein LutC
MERIDTFEKAARLINARGLRAGRAEVEEVVAAHLRTIGARRIVCWSERVKLDGFERCEPADADCGITDAEWGIASTGTLVLPMTAAAPRSASLLPGIHLAILNADRILSDEPAALLHIGETYMKQKDRPSSVVLVTGPSRTADIELNLVLGVHGPKELHIVVVVPGQEAEDRKQKSEDKIKAPS